MNWGVEFKKWGLGFRKLIGKSLTFLSHHD
jgi:hypothetical protein